MMDVGSIVTYLKRVYPVPQIDPAWVQECANALSEDGQQPTREAVLEQYLYSDLATSTIPSSLLINAAESHNTLLFPLPTLLQITAITEIGSSAFQLQTVLEQRRDVLDGVTRIRGMDDTEEEEQALDEGKLPTYPRGMLKLELSDGKGKIKAMEYRRMGDMKLGETALGTKLLLHKVKILRGILLLTADNTSVIGGMVEHLEADQPAQFVSSLKARLDAATNGALPRPNGTSRGARGRARPAIKTSPPPRAVQPGRTTATQPARGTRPKPPARRQQPITVISDDDDTTAAGPSRRARPPTRIQKVEEDDFGGDDSFFGTVDIDQIIATTTQRNVANVQAQAAHRHNDDDFDFDEFGADDSFIRQVDEVVMRTQSAGGSSGLLRRGESSVTEGRPPGNSARKRQRVYSESEEEDSYKENRPEIIEISD